MTTDIFHIVGIGASAGGLEALEQFFQALPQQANMAFVVIQHLSPDYKSMMAEILSKSTAMPVCEAADIMPVKPGHVYLIPPKKMMTISQGCLRLTEKSRQSGLVLPIDTFFHSLAQDQGEQAIAIVLSGTGSDGTRGIRSIKEQDGMVMVQRRDSARFDGMPQSAINTGLADFVLSPGEMPEALTKFVVHPTISLPSNSTEPPLAQGDPLTRILTQVKNYARVDFNQYKPATVLRRIERRASIRQCRDVNEYVQLLEGSEVECKTLYKELLIGVTQFFRNTDTFAKLEELIIPQIFASKQPDEGIRVWVAGCSTGEEAYSIAFLLAEYREKINAPQDIKIFATDIDTQALEFAASAEYPESTVADVPPERLASFLVKRDNDHYVVNPKLRKMVVFAQHDLTSSPPFNRLDLISCRNLFIYLQASVQERILHLFHFALKQQGFLLLGESESISDSASIFHCLDKHHKLYRARAGVSPTSPHWREMPHLLSELSQLPPPLVPVTAGSKSVSRQLSDNLQKILLERFLPPCLLINDNLDVLYVSDHAGRYLHVRGLPDYSLLRMLPDSMAAYARTAVNNALKQGRPVVYKASLDKYAADSPQINLHVEPLRQKHGGAPLLLVRFEDSVPLPLPSSDEIPLEFSPDSRQHLEEIEKELTYTRETLQATIEELETSNEELQSTNEELLAANEELQSTNEELQAVNEELVTVNSEHQHKIQELEEVNETVDNLMRSSRVGTVFLDEKLRIRRFNPAIQQEVHLIDNDIGRPFDDIRHHLKYPALQHDLQQVMLHQQGRDLEVESEDGRWYLLQISPYLTRGGSINGCVVNLVNITQRKHTEQRMQDSEERLQLATEAGGIGIWELDIETNGLRLDDMMFHLYGMSDDNAADTYEQWRAHIHADDLPIAEGILQQSIANKTPNFEQQFRVLHPNGDTRYIHARARLLCKKNGTPCRVLGVNWDETRELSAMQALRQTRDVLNTTQELARIGGWEYDIASQRLLWTEQMYHLYELEPGTLINLQQCQQFYHSDDQSRIHAALNEALQQGTEWDIECRFVGATGTPLWVRSSGKPIYENHNIIKLQGFLQDISAQKSTEAELYHAREAAEQANRAKSAFLANMSHELRTPLNAIMGYIQLLQSDAEISQQAHDKLGIVQRSSEHLLTLINDVLDLAKVEAGKLESKKTDIHLQGFLDDIVQMFKIRAEEKNLTFFYETSFIDDATGKYGLPVKVKTDEKHLREILINLLGNAVKFTHQGQITLRISYAQDKMRLDVEDSGSGIPEQELTSIFEPFHQGSSSFYAGGTGLGLSISKRLVDLLEGTLTVKSTPQVGSVFSVELPLQVTQWEEQDQDSLEPPPPSIRRVKGYQGARRKVLVVDDIAENRSVLVDFLHPLGFQVAEAVNGKNALAVADTFVPDIILMDLRMPVMNGFDCISALRQQEAFKQSAIIACSASVFHDQQQRAFTLGANDFLEKPLNIMELISSFERHCGIEWIEEVSSTGTLGTVVKPPDALLQPLREAVQIGDINRIETLLEALDSDEYAVFRDKGLKYIQQFNLSALQKLVDTYGSG